MAEWLKRAYAHALDVIDPATADEVSIRDAFRHYSPISMQQRMVTLFVALFEAAGVRPSVPKASLKKAGATGAPARVVRAVRMVPRAMSERATSPKVLPPGAGVPGLHPALAGLLASLPETARGWTQADRDRFMAAFGVVLDFAHPPGVLAQQANSAESDDDLA